MTHSNSSGLAIFRAALVGSFLFSVHASAYITDQNAAVVIGQSLFTNSTLNQGGAIGANTLNSPYGVFCDGTRFYVADVNSNRVLIFNSIPSANNANANVVVGQSSMSGGAPNQGGSPAANTMNAPYAVIVVGTKLIVAEGVNNRVLIFNTIPTTNNASADVEIGQPDFASSAVNQGGSPAANTFDKPLGLYSDGTRLFVSDNMNNRVLVFNSIPTTNNASADLVIGQPDFVSNGINQSGSAAANTLYYPGNAIVVGGKLLIADSFNARILIYNTIPSANNTSADVVIGQTDMSGSSINQGGAVGPNTNGRANGMWSDGTRLFISDQGNNRILVYNSMPSANNASANTVLGQPDLTSGAANQGGSTAVNTLNNPNNVTGFGSQLFMSDIVNNRALIFNDLAPACLGNFLFQWGGPGTGNGTFNIPVGLAVDASNDIYVVDATNNLVQEFTNGGNFMTQWGGFNQPNAVVVGALGNVYVSDTYNNLIKEFTPGGTPITQWGGVNHPAQVAVDGSGDLYVADNGNNRIVEFSSSGSVKTTWGSVGGGMGTFSGPWGVAVDSLGNVYVGDNGNSLIQKFTSSGNFITQWGTLGSGPAQFLSGASGTHQLAVDGSNNVYVTDTGNNRIQEFDSSGNLQTIFGSAGGGSGTFNNPQGIVLDSYGSAFVGDSSNNLVQKFGCTLTTPTYSPTLTVTPTWSPTSSPTWTPTATSSGTPTATPAPTFSTTPPCSVGATISWSTGPSMPTKRSFSGSVLYNGIAYVMGGDAGGVSTATMEAFNILGNNWTTLSPMPQQRWTLAAAEANGKIYAFAGFNSQTDSYPAATFEYDPLIDSWATKATIGQPRGEIGAAAVNGKIFLIGGVNGSGSNVFNLVDEYNPIADSFSSVAPLPIALRGCATVVAGGLVYAMGGLDSTMTSTNTNFVFDPVANSWQTLAPMPSAISNAIAVTIGGKIYLTSGETWPPDDASGITYVYDIGSNSWSSNSSLPQAVGGATAFTSQNRIFVVGGLTVPLSPTVNVDTLAIGDLVCNPTVTITLTFTPTATRTVSATCTPTASPTASPTWTPTATLSDTGTATQSSTPTSSPPSTASPTDSGTASPSPTPTSSPTVSGTPSYSATPTATLVSTGTRTPTPPATASPAPADPGNGIIVGPSPIQCPGSMARFHMAKPGRYHVKVLGLRGQLEQTFDGEDHIGGDLAQCYLTCASLSSGIHFVLVEIDNDDGTTQRIKPTKYSVVK